MLLSAGYALSGYTMLFYQNSVWLDVMAVMPPLYRSACAMTRRGGGWGYLFWLTVLLMLQYYLGYAVLLFLILWAAAAALLEVPYGERGRFALRVGCFTAGALALSAPVWLPSLFEVMASARTVNVVGLDRGRALVYPALYHPFFPAVLGCTAAGGVPLSSEAQHRAKLGAGGVAALPLAAASACF